MVGGDLVVKVKLRFEYAVKSTGIGVFGVNLVHLLQKKKDDIYIY